MTLEWGKLGMKTKVYILLAMMTVGLLAGCEDDDSPSQPGDSTMTVENASGSTIGVAYESQTWDILYPGVDVSHTVHVVLASKQSSDISVHFGDKLGTSIIKITKDGKEKIINVGFGLPRLTIRDSDFTGG